MSANSEKIKEALGDAGFENAVVHYSRKGGLKGWYYQPDTRDAVIYLGLTVDDALAKIDELPNPNLPEDRKIEDGVSVASHPEIYEEAEIAPPPEPPPLTPENYPHLYDEFGNLLKSSF